MLYDVGGTNISRIGHGALLLTVEASSEEIELGPLLMWHADRPQKAGSAF